MTYWEHTYYNSLKRFLNSCRYEIVMEHVKWQLMVLFEPKILPLNTYCAYQIHHWTYNIQINNAIINCNVTAIIKINLYLFLIHTYYKLNGGRSSISVKSVMNEHVQYHNFQRTKSPLIMLNIMFYRHT